MIALPRRGPITAVTQVPGFFGSYVAGAAGSSISARRHTLNLAEHALQPRERVMQGIREIGRNFA